MYFLLPCAIVERTGSHYRFTIDTDSLYYIAFISSLILSAILAMYSLFVGLVLPS